MKQNEGESEEGKEKIEELENDAKEAVFGDNDEEVCYMLRFAFYFLLEIFFRV